MRSRNVATALMACLWGAGILLSSPHAGRAGSIDLQTRDPKNRRNPKAIARGFLQSDVARYLSASGRNALELMSGARPGLGSLRAGPEPAASGTAAPGLSGIRVNDPNQDPFAASDATTQSETAVAAFGPNVLVAFNDSGEFPTQYSFMGYARSTDGGATFTDMGVVPRGFPTAYNLGDPALVANRLGHFYVAAIVFDYRFLFGSPYRVGIQKSSNGGLSWGDLVYPPPFVEGSFADKEFMAVDNTAGPFSGNVYVTWTNFSPYVEVPIVLSRSTDGGATFSAPIRVSTNGAVNQGSEPVVGPSGEVYVAWLQISSPVGPHPGPGILVARSTDGGVTFGTPSWVAPVTPIGFASGNLPGNFRTNSFPRIDVNPVNGHVYVVFTSNPIGPDACDVFFSRSMDAGTTWSNPIRVNDDHGTADQWFPDLAVNSRGRILTFWYDRRRHGDKPGDFRLDVFGAGSADGGASFGANQRIGPTRAASDAGMLPAVGYDPYLDPTYMGDYNDIRAETTPTGPGPGFLAAWGDFSRLLTNEGGTRPDQDVVFARFSSDLRLAGSSADQVSPEFGAVEPDETPARPTAPIATPGAIPPSTAPRLEGDGSARVRVVHPNVEVSPGASRSTGPIEFRLELPTQGRVTFTIFDAGGRRVRDLLDDDLPSGEHTYHWDRRGDRGLELPAGVYFYRLVAPGMVNTGKVVLSR